MNIAIIPARGGSKRIPRKNIRTFIDKPMIAWPIGLALESALFDRVIVSTDDNEIREVSLAYGAEVPFVRPIELSHDHATTRSVIQHAIEEIERTHTVDVDLSCCIYPASPFLTVADLSKGMEALTKEGFTFSFGAAEYPHPIQRALRRGTNGGVAMMSPEFQSVRTQDLEKTFHDAGVFYWGTREGFLGQTSVFSEKSKPILIPRYRTHDIDEEEDWLLAEYLHRAIQQRAS